MDYEYYKYIYCSLETKERDRVKVYRQDQRNFYFLLNVKHNSHTDSRPAAVVVRLSNESVCASTRVGINIHSRRTGFEPDPLPNHI
jgi:hypothetical protein